MQPQQQSKTFDLEFKDVVGKRINWMDDFIDENQHIINGISESLKLHRDITPSMEQVLSAFRMVSMDPHGLLPNSIKAVWIFQDPYPGKGQACGISTCCLDGSIPQTLSNIYKRMRETIEGFNTPVNGDIRGWASQGILMLNMYCTTVTGRIMAHQYIWSLWTELLIKWMNEKYPYLVFVLFGAEARGLSSKINQTKHSVLTTSHPSGRGYHAGFDKSDIFNDMNRCLIKNCRTPIDWNKTYTS